MSRIVKPQVGHRTRAKTLRLIERAAQDYFERREERKDDELLNIASFIALSLDEIETSVQQTLDAWERRGYWIKADHFHEEWRWVEQAKKQLIDAIRKADIPEVDRAVRGLLEQARSKGEREATKAKKGIDYSEALQRLIMKFGP